MSSSHILLGLPSIRILRVFPINILYAFIVSPHYSHMFYPP
jgi:hypothetical protein